MKNAEIFGFKDGVLQLFYIIGAVDQETGGHYAGFLDGMGILVESNTIVPEIEKELATKPADSKFIIKTDAAYGIGLFLEDKIGEEAIKKAAVTEEEVIFPAIKFTVDGKEITADVVVVEEIDSCNFKTLVI